MTTLIAVALALALWLARRGRSLGSGARLTGWIVVVAALALAAVIAPPLVVARKMVGFVLMPTTLVWLLIAAVAVRWWHERRLRVTLLAVLACYSIAGSPVSAYLLLRSLERPFEDLHPLAATHRYDAVLLMGGGSASLPHGHAEDYELGTSGDRLRLAAALYASNRTPLLVTSGSSLDFERDISAETAALLQGMGVPEAAIYRVPGPRNSVEEIRAFAGLIEERGWKRLAIVSSARHLPRVIALCRRHGVDAEPLPSDFRAEPPPLELLMIVPDGEAFADVEQAVWEYVGLAAVHVLGG